MARKRKRGVLKRAEQFFRQTATVIRPLRLECTANRRAVVEGCMRILEYDENRIVLQTAEGTLGFEGERLRISRMADDCALISGSFSAVLFEEGTVCG